MYDIARCAYGTLQGDKIDADVSISKQILLRLFSCRIERGRISKDIEKRLVQKCEHLEIYKDEKASGYVRSKLLWLTCSVIRKYKYDHFKEEWNMALEPEKKDRSYQFGRLLAVFEKIERDTYDAEEKRETTAIRMQPVFTQRPLYASRIIQEQLKKAYFPRLRPGSRVYYEKLVGQIMEMISQTEESGREKALDDTYLLGYYLQKNDF